MIVILPWPHAGLSPNARVHRMKLVSLKRKYRSQCAWECQIQNLRKIDAEYLHITITFHPPDKRRRDLDNMLASIKSGLDGVADIVGVDDSKWTLTIVRGLPVRSGQINIQFGAAND